jgi:hypothetical protein
MISEETLLAKFRQLSEKERQQLLEQIETWLQRTVASPPLDVQRGLAAIKNTWATIHLDRDTLRWVAESKELEYDVR